MTYVSEGPPHQNDISMLVDAMHLVWKKEPNVEVWLIGNPDRRLKTIAAKHQKIRLLGPVQRNLLLNYVCNFDVAVYLYIRVGSIMVVGFP